MAHKDIFNHSIPLGFLSLLWTSSMFYSLTCDLDLIEIEFKRIVFFSDLAPPLAVVCPSSHRQQCQHCLYKVHFVSYIVNFVNIFYIASPRAPFVLIFDIFLPDFWSCSSSRDGMLLLTGQTTWLPPIQFETHLTSYLGMSSKNDVIMVIPIQFEKTTPIQI